MSDEMHMDGKEGLNYGTDNYKFKKADKPESQLEGGKITEGRDPSYETEYKAAESLRHQNGGCSDPCYKEK